MAGDTLNFPLGAFVDKNGGLTQAARLWLLNPSTFALNLATALAPTSGGTGVALTPLAGELLIGDGTGNFTATTDLPASSGGTGHVSYTVGDILYADSATTLARLPAGTNGYVVTSNGPGSAPGYQAGGIPSVANDTIVSNVSGATATPIGNSITTLFDSIVSSARGAIVTRTSAGWASLNPPPSAGYVLTSNGTFGDLSWNPSARLSTSSPIDGKAVTATVLYTSPTGKTTTVTGAVVHVSAASAITIGAHADIYTTTAGDICASQNMTLLTASPTTFTFLVAGSSVDVPAGGTIKFNLNTAATGTSQTLVVDLLGYLT